MTTIFSTVEMVPAKLKMCRNSDKLLNEWEHVKAGSNCNFCWLKLVHDNLPLSMMENTEDLNLIYYYTVRCSKQDLEDENCLNRLFKQKTEPITDYAYRVEVDSENAAVCNVYMAFKTESGKRPHARTVERAFPERAEIAHKLPTKISALDNILNHEDCVKRGEWIY